MPNDASWVVRKLLKLRDICQGWIRYCIGDGEDTFFLTDNWHPLGALYKQFGGSIVPNRGRALRAKVSSIIVQGSWHCPRQRSRVMMEVMRQTPANFLPNSSTKDKVIWTLSLDRCYSVKTTWEACRHLYSFKHWLSFVWFSQNVPR